MLKTEIDYLWKNFGPIFISDFKTSRITKYISFK